MVNGVLQTPQKRVMRRWLACANTAARYEALFAQPFNVGKQFKQPAHPAMNSRP